VINGSKVTIRPAAVQARPVAGQIEANLEHAAGLVEQAVAKIIDELIAAVAVTATTIAAS
jgi:predicted amidohydrolase